jgi:hypothetical protein
VTPTAEAADILRRYLASRGRRDRFHVFDGEPFGRWLGATGLRDAWDDCRQRHGGDAELLTIVRAEHPELVDADPRGLLDPENLGHLPTQGT